MAKLTVWLHQGTSIPSGHHQASLTSAFTGSDGRLTNDGWYEFLGTEAVIKTDFKSVNPRSPERGHVPIITLLITCIPAWQNYSCSSSISQH